LYGLAVDPASQDAIEALFDVKGRDASRALPFIAASHVQVETWCHRIDPRSAVLARAFWPGPLSLVLDAPTALAAGAIGPHHTVAIRVPAHPVSRALCDLWGAPLPATSANRSGEPPARQVDRLGPIADDDRVLVVDAGDAPGGEPSTIVDVRGEQPILLRRGAIAWERVLRSLEA
jgi:L-threonylcarbamoyladenylate synthase